MRLKLKKSQLDALLNEGVDYSKLKLLMEADFNKVMGEAQEGDVIYLEREGLTDKRFKIEGVEGGSVTATDIDKNVDVVFRSGGFNTNTGNIQYYLKDKNSPIAIGNVTNLYLGRDGDVVEKIETDFEGDTDGDDESARQKAKAAQQGKGEEEGEGEDKEETKLTKDEIEQLKQDPLYNQAIKKGMEIDRILSDLSPKKGIKGKDRKKFVDGRRITFTWLSRDMGEGNYLIEKGDQLTGTYNDGIIYYTLNKNENEKGDRRLEMVFKDLESIKDQKDEYKVTYMVWAGPEKSGRRIHTSNTKEGRIRIDKYNQ